MKHTWYYITLPGEQMGMSTFYRNHRMVYYPISGGGGGGGGLCISSGNFTYILIFQLNLALHTGWNKIKHGTNFFQIRKGVFMLIGYDIIGII